MDKQQPDDSDGQEAGAIAKYAGIGFQMLAIIGLFTYAGLKVDQAAGHQTKWVTAVLSLTGVFISLYIIIRAAKN